MLIDDWQWWGVCAALGRKMGRLVEKIKIEVEGRHILLSFYYTHNAGASCRAFSPPHPSLCFSLLEVPKTSHGNGHSQRYISQGASEKDTWILPVTVLRWKNASVGLTLVCMGSCSEK